ncbi:MAG TPA: hypothetical protein VLH56_19065 [Dissulfurispiraceae bacterium]|nr:hypothetical protein [Dissulfurispiraceae bacterium]
MTRIKALETVEREARIKALEWAKQYSTIEAFAVGETWFENGKACIEAEIARLKAEIEQHGAEARAERNEDNTAWRKCAG